MSSITTRNGRRCTAVPKIANIAAVSISSSSSSTSTSTSSSTTSTSTSSSSTSTSTLSSTETSTSLSSSSSTSTLTSTTADVQPTQIQNPEQPAQTDPLATSPTETLPSTTSTTPVNNPIPTIAAPVIGSTTTSLPSVITSTTADGTPTTPASLIVDTGSPTLSPSQQGDETQNSTNQAGDSITSTADGLFTTGGSLSTNSALESETNGPGLPSTQAAVTGNAITTTQTIAIAGGVVGGVIIISLFAFMIWIWRKRKVYDRRSTLLTPLTPDATFRDNEKGPYLISRGSIGPTPASEKLWAAFGMKYRRLRGRVNDIVTRSNSPSPSVNLDRGTSQFGPPDTMHSRNNSSAGGAVGGEPASKGRFVDWWGRLAEDSNFNWRLRHESKAEPIANGSYAVARSTNEGSLPRAGSQPDFLTLMNMDDTQLERERARGRSSVKAGPRRSMSVGGESHFLGGLGLNFDMADPFSDVNAISTNKAKATPMVVSAANNPFSDTNAIAPPQAVPKIRMANGALPTYVQNVRRSRTHSVNGSISRQPSNASRYYRESNVSVDTVGTRRNKFRSDPFDLDRPDLLRSANSSTAALPGGSSRASRTSKSNSGLPNTPRQAHVRTESFTSKYSSGVSSMGGWSDPGPDVGPAAGRYTPDSGLGRRDSETRRSGASQGSVGKAL